MPCLYYKTLIYTVEFSFPNILLRIFGSMFTGDISLYVLLVPKQRWRPLLMYSWHLQGRLFMQSSWLGMHRSYALSSVQFRCSWSLLKLMFIELVMPSNHLILCRPLLLPSNFNLSQHQGLFQWVSSLLQVAKVLEIQLQHQSFQWIFRSDFL